MDLCGLDEAFGLISQPSASCLGGSSTTESRKHDRKKAKKCRGPQQAYLESDMSFLGQTTDPDRPAVKRMESVPVNESFVGESGGGDLATIRKVVQGNNLLQKGDKPSYFGASPNDSPNSAIPGKKKEGFEDVAMPYGDVIGEESGKLNHDFTNDAKAWQQAKNGLVNMESPKYGILSDELKGLETPELPPPETSFDWQKAGLRGYEKAKPKKAEKSDDINKQEILRKMDTILSRLDDMQYVDQENAQKEVLLFIMTGLGILFVMDIACRASS
jgi:hypothetical protein